MTDSGVLVNASATTDLENLSMATRAALQTAIKDAVGEGVVVRVGLPNHMNVGDLALTLAETALLRSAGVTACRISLCNNPRSSTAPGRKGTAFVIQGGGNLGDIYPHELALRIAVLNRHPTLPILQMPQSIHFRERRNIEEFRAAVGRSARYRLLVRDTASYDWARDNLDCQVSLVPDSVITLGRLTRPKPVEECVALIRADVESIVDRSTFAAIGTVFDWPSWSDRVWWERLLWPRWPRDFAESMLPAPHRWVAWRLYERIVSLRVERGVAALARGKFVVTDRLHGHILASLLGIPHVVLDNSYGKVSSFMDSWQIDRLVPVRRVHDANPRSVVTRLGELKQSTTA